MIVEYVDEITYDKFKPMLDECFPEEYVSELAFINNIEHKHFIFGKYNDQLFGYVLFDKSTYTARLIHICVIRKYQGKGLGEKLLANLIEYMKRLECRNLSLRVDISNEPAIKLYRKLGFTTYETQFQYSVDLEDIKSPNQRCKIEPIGKNELDFIENRYSIGSTVINYLFESKRSSLFQILDHQNQTCGMFAFDSTENIVSPLYLDHPELIDDLLPRIAILVANGDSIRLIFESDGIEKFMYHCTGATFDFELLSMRKTF